MERFEIEKQRWLKILEGIQVADTLSAQARK